MTDVIYIDFCHTVVSKFTLGMYIRYVLIREYKLILLFRYRIKLASFEDLIQALSRVQESRRQKYGMNFAKYLENFKIKSVIDEVSIKAKQGVDIVWVSAGLEEYIRPFSERNGIFAAHYITSTTGNKESNYLYENVYGDVKLKKIIEYEENKNYVSRMAISDHSSDFPMLNYANEPVVVEGPDRKFIEVARGLGWRVIQRL